MNTFKFSENHSWDGGLTEEQKCRNKVQYKDYGTAFCAAILQGKRMGLKLWVYRCQVCKLWHLTKRKMLWSHVVEMRLEAAGWERRKLGESTLWCDPIGHKLWIRKAADNILHSREHQKERKA